MFHINRITLISLFIASMSCVDSRAEDDFVIDADEMDEKTIEAIEKPDFTQKLFDSFKKPSKKEEFISWAQQFKAVFLMHYFMKSFSEASLHAYGKYPAHMKSDYVTKALKLCPLLFAWILSSNAQENIAREHRTEPSSSANITAWATALLAPSLTLGAIRYFGI
jgi:hypothetical protein